MHVVVVHLEAIFSVFLLLLFFFFFTVFNIMDLMVITTSACVLTLALVLEQIYEIN